MEEKVNNFTCNKTGKSQNQDSSSYLLDYKALSQFLDWVNFHDLVIIDT